jgi:hypothetical protein
MSMTVRLETENGEVLESVSDPSNALHRILPAHDDAAYGYVGCIDWYGDTTFNALQIPRFLSEWSRLLPAARAHGSEGLHRKVEAMAKRCQQEVHVYLKFLGD